MAPDRRLLDEHQVELARELCRLAREYTEQQLERNTSSFRPGMVPIRHLRELRRRLTALQALLDGLLPSRHS